MAEDSVPVRNITYSAPKSVLSSTRIKTALATCLVPAVTEKCGVVAIRCCFESCSRADAVKQLAARRRQIELKLIEIDDAAFAVTAITGVKRTKPTSSATDRPAPDTSAADQTQNEATAAADNEQHNDDEDKVYPGISIWGAFSVPACLLSQKEHELLSILQTCGFSVLDCKTIDPRMVTDNFDKACKSLYCVIKDHNWPYAVSLSQESAESFLHDTIPGSEDVSFKSWSPGFGKCVVRMILYPNCPDDTAGKILHAKGTMVLKSLTYDFNNMKENVVPSAKIVTKSCTKDKMTQCIELLDYIMQKEDKRFYKGVVVGKPHGSLTSYTEETNVRDYLNELCNIPEYSSLITGQLNNVVNFLQTNPSYGGLRHIRRDMTLIEVTGGWYYNLMEREFIQDAIPAEDIGVNSPRKFFPYPYTPGKIPYQKEFVDSLRNSFPDDPTLKRFVQMLYQLLLSLQWPFKRKKLMCVGPSNCGKTTWLEPILCVIDQRKLATCTDEGVFGAQGVDTDTEMIILDDWDPALKKLGEYKRMLQCGKMWIKVKHQLPKLINYKSGVYMTLNELPDFGSDEHGKAMMDRIEVFHCKKIPGLRPGMELKFREHAMEIIHWMGEFVKDMPLWEDSDIRGEEFELQESSEHYIPSVVDLSDLPDVDESVLPRSTVVRAHLDVYDTTADTQVLPYRLTSAEYDFNSIEYHESIYLNIQGKFRNAIDKNTGYDLETLFRARRQVGWYGVDSLYHAWLLVNFRLSPHSLSMKTFTERYPDWRQVMIEVIDLTPETPESQSTVKEELTLFQANVTQEHCIDLCSDDDTNMCRKQSRSGRDLESGNLEEECDEDYSEDRARTDRRESRIHGMAMESGDSIDDISDEDTTTLKKKNNVEADKEMSERDVLFGMLKGYSVTRKESVPSKDQGCSRETPESQRESIPSEEQRCSRETPESTITMVKNEDLVLFKPQQIKREVIDLCSEDEDIVTPDRVFPDQKMCRGFPSKRLKFEL